MKRLFPSLWKMKFSERGVADTQSVSDGVL